MRARSECVFEAARNVNPRQPLTACWQAWDLSDVGSFHCYMKPGSGNVYDLNGLTFEQEVSRMVEWGVLFSARNSWHAPSAMSWQTSFPSMRKSISAGILGMCAGAAQYQYPWGWPEGSPEPKRWFHCLLYPDGTPFDDLKCPSFRISNILIDFCHFRFIFEITVNCIRQILS